MSLEFPLKDIIFYHQKISMKGNSKPIGPKVGKLRPKNSTGIY